MKTMIRFIPLVAALVVTQICIAQAPAGAPAGATAICNDGTYFMGATKQGGCRGHKGIKTWFGATAAAPAAAPAAKSAPAPVAAAASAPASAPGGAPAGATAICNDGTYFMGATKQGGCRGHQGIKTWFGATAAAPAAAPVAKSAPAPVATPAPAPPPPALAAPPTTRANSSTIAPAAGGGPGLVWVNTASNVYHCSGTQWYGKTKAGAYMSEDQAKAKGAHPDHGKPCK